MPGRPLARVTVEPEGFEQLRRVMIKAPPEIRKRATKAMRMAAGPAQAAASSAVHWSANVTIRARSAGAAVGTRELVPPIIEFGHKAVVSGGGVQAPHVRKLTPQPALIPAVEGQTPLARTIAERELGRLLDEMTRG